MDNDQAYFIAVIAGIFIGAALLGLAVAVFVHWLFP